MLRGPGRAVARPHETLFWEVAFVPSPVSRSVLPRCAPVPSPESGTAAHSGAKDLPPATLAVSAAALEARAAAHLERARTQLDVLHRAPEPATVQSVLVPYDDAIELMPRAASRARTRPS
jgi:hypothetical protein